MILYWRPIDLWIVIFIFPGWFTEKQISVEEVTRFSFSVIEQEMSPEIYKPVTIHSLFIIITIELLVYNRQVGIKLNIMEKAFVSVISFSLLYVVQRKKIPFSKSLYSTTPGLGLAWLKIFMGTDCMSCCKRPFGWCQ